MRPVRITKSLAAASDNNIAQSQTPGAAGALTLNGSTVVGGVAILDTPRRVLLTFAADETGHNFVITGNQKVDGTGNTISETIAGTAPGTAQSVLDYGGVTSVTISAAATGAIKVGTNGVGSTPWQMVDTNLDPMSLVVSVDVTGTVNYTVQYTYSDIMGAYDAANGQWANAATPVAWNDPILASVTSDGETTYNNPITAWRVVINSGSGSLAIVGIQAGVGGIGS